MISDDRVEKAVEFLRDTAKQYGQLRGRTVYCDANLRRVKSLEMLGREGGVGQREAEAYASPAYLAAMEDQENAEAEFHTLKAQREAADATIEVWRSQASARKAGII